MYAMSHSNVKVQPSSILDLRGAFHTLPLLILFTRNGCGVCTLTLCNSGNSPLDVSSL